MEDGYHKDLFPLDSSDYWGLILACLGLMIAAVRTQLLRIVWSV